MSTLPPNWVEQTDSSGKKYYYNTATREKSSSRPAGPNSGLSAEASTGVEHLSPPKSESVKTRLVNFFKPYFDIDTDDLTMRVMESVKFVDNRFMELTEYKPDLYGPFWIYTSLIIILGIASNTYIPISEIEPVQDLAFITAASSLIYTVGFGAPFLIWGLATRFGSDLSYIQLLCLYGYSCTIYLPALVICIIPKEIIRWLVLMYAMASSTLFVVSNLKRVTDVLSPNSKNSLLVLVATLHIFLGLSFKLYFFKFIYVK